MNFLQTIKSTLESKKSFKIAFVGDSITSAEWIHPNWREIIEYVLKEELTKLLEDWITPSWGIRCFNYGFDGSSSGDINGFIKSGTIPSDADLVIYQLGDNDRHVHLSTETYAANVAGTLNLLQGNVVLCSDPAGASSALNANYEKNYYPCFVQKSSGLKVISVDLFKEFQKLDLPSLYTLVNLSGNEVAGIKSGETDPIHPNRLGNAYIAKFILEQAFQIPFNPEKYLEDLKNDIMYPTYQ